MTSISAWAWAFYCCWPYLRCTPSLPLSTSRPLSPDWGWPRDVDNTGDWWLWPVPSSVRLHAAFTWIIITHLLSYSHWPTQTAHGFNWCPMRIPIVISCKLTPVIVNHFWWSLEGHFNQSRLYQNPLNFTNRFDYSINYTKAQKF